MNQLDTQYKTKKGNFFFLFRTNLQYNPIVVISSDKKRKNDSSDDESDKDDEEGPGQVDSDNRHSRYKNKSGTWAAAFCKLRQTNEHSN